MTDGMGAHAWPSPPGLRQSTTQPTLARAALVVCAVVLSVSGGVVAADRDPAARVVLLPSADRASVVIEVDENVQHTSIRTADDRTVIVEIGPVRQRVVNQLLQAAEASPLVSQVRVRGVTRGGEGTLISLHIVGKASISGSVRRQQRRVYIDLEPLASVAAATERLKGEAGHGSTAAIEPAKAPTPPAGRPSTPPAAPPDSVPSRKPSRAIPTAPHVARAPAREVMPTRTATAATPVAPVAAASSIIGRAEALAGVPDVKGLERLKAEVIEGRSASDDVARSTVDAAVGRLDSLLAEARKRQLLADARLFRGNQGAPAHATPTTGPAQPLDSPPAKSGAALPMAPAARPAETAPAGGFQQAMRQLRPELERVNGTISVLTPGAVLSGDLPAQIESVLSRLRALSPPGELGSTHERACGALSSLLTGWIRAPNGQWVIAIGGDPSTLENTRAAMFDYLREFDRFDRQGTPMTMSVTERR